MVTVDIMTCSKLSKTTVTKIHPKYPHKKGGITVHMCHREATAAKYYKMITNEGNSVDCKFAGTGIKNCDTTRDKSMRKALETIVTFPVPTLLADIDEVTDSNGSSQNEENRQETNNDTTDECDTSNDIDYKPDDDVADDYGSDKYTLYAVEENCQLKMLL